MDGVKGRLITSLQWRLSLWIALAMLATAAAAAGLSYSSALQYAHQQQDNQLRQTGFLISRLDTVPSSPMAAREKAGDIDFDARVVVRFLATPEHPAVVNPARPPAFPADLGDGLQTISVDGEAWRVFVRSNTKGVRVAVGQHTLVRDAAARATAWRTLMPFLLMVPLLALLVSVLVRQMFTPLRTLAAALGRRPEDALGLLTATGLPSEVWPFVTEMNLLLERMGRALMVQRRFIADAAHELRSPMTAMSLQAERLGAAAMSAEARTRLQALTAGLQRSRVLLDQLLALARAQDAQQEVSSVLSLRQTVREVLEDLMPLAEEKGIDLGVVGEFDGQVSATPVDLKALVKNLCDNAVRYTPDGGRVDITLTRSEGLLVLQLDDTGPGIAAHERERVFDPFYRILGSDAMGSGLGLAITRAAAERMGATIALGDAHPERGGLRVRVTFPTAPKRAAQHVT